jgi:hypothetical protein
LDGLASGALDCSGCLRATYAEHELAVPLSLSHELARAPLARRDRPTPPRRGQARMWRHSRPAECASKCHAAE